MPKQKEPAAPTPDAGRLQVPQTFWRAVEQRNVEQICNATLFRRLGNQRLVFRFLNRDVMVDIAAHCLRHKPAGDWQRLDDPLLELVTVNYLMAADALHPLGGDIVGVKDLKEGHFFRGPHALNLSPLLSRYGKDLAGFRQAALSLGGDTVEMADAACTLWPFPRIPLYFLLWEGDDEFQPRMSVLFDRSIESVLAADAIWGLVNRVSRAILTPPT